MRADRRQPHIQRAGQSADKLRGFELHAQREVALGKGVGIAHGLGIEHAGRIELDSIGRMLDDRVVAGRIQLIEARGQHQRLGLLLHVPKPQTQDDDDQHVNHRADEPGRQVAPQAVPGLSEKMCGIDVRRSAAEAAIGTGVSGGVGAAGTEVAAGVRATAGECWRRDQPRDGCRAARYRRHGRSGSLRRGRPQGAPAWARVGLIAGACASNSNAWRCCSSVSSMLAPHRQQSANPSQSRMDMGARQSGHAHDSTSPSSQIDSSTAIAHAPAADVHRDISVGRQPLDALAPASA